MKRALTAEEMRSVEQAAYGMGMPAAVLMENAGRALAEQALSLATPKGRFFIICGTGHNGGDGLVAARTLAARGREVCVELLDEPNEYQGEPLRCLTALQASGVLPMKLGPDTWVEVGDVVIDAIYGTGLNRAPEGKAAEAIARIALWRTTGAKVVAADIPSGLSSDKGLPFKSCVTADLTVAFGALKCGHLSEPGNLRCGETRLAEIGIPEAAFQTLSGPKLWVPDEADVSARLKPRAVHAHKGTFGHVLIVGGSPGKAGAPALAGLGALSAGAGLVTLAARTEVLTESLRFAPELMGHSLRGQGPLGVADLDGLLSAAEGKTAIVLGPGMWRSTETVEMLTHFLAELRVPCVLDADALNAFADRVEQLQQASGELVLTPILGEMARLVGCEVAAVQADRLLMARTLAARVHAWVVLKGARTVIASTQGDALVNSTGNPGMATAGSGDVLAGVMGAFLGQKMSTEDAVVAAVFAHGLSGDLMLDEAGQLGLRATDLLLGLRRVWTRWKK